MWQLDNRTPFAAERTWVRGLGGEEIWLVAVKATFDWASEGPMRVADPQPPVTLAPVYLGAPGRSSLRYDTDLPRTKCTTDVIVIGHAHAPCGVPVQRLDVSIAVGSVSRRLRVVGDRRWHRGKSISTPQLFASMPLTWERAYGGRDARRGSDPERPSFDMRNPVGTGWADAPDHLHETALPNVEDPEALITRWNDRPTPAGFGAVAAHWQPRLPLAGTYDEPWQHDRFPLLPTDFDDRHYQWAPARQQSPRFLRGGEPVALHNLTPGGGDRHFSLPRVFLGFETAFTDGTCLRHAPPQLHGVILEPDTSRLSIVFHTALPCHARVHKLDRTRITLKQDLRDGVLMPATAAALEP